MRSRCERDGRGNKGGLVNSQNRRSGDDWGVEGWGWGVLFLTAAARKNANESRSETVKRL